MVQGTLASKISKFKALMTRKNLVTAIHWTSVGSAIVVSVVTAVDLPSNQKIVGLATAAMLLAFNQALQKFSSSLDHQATLAQALIATLPLIQAATTGSPVQTEAVKAAAEKVTETVPPVVPASVTPLIKPAEAEPKQVSSIL